MTDKEIIKALECCSTPHTEVKCYCCKSANGDICSKLNPTIILDLIRRQQEEINQFAEADKMVVETKTVKSDDDIKAIQRDAVVNFAEKLKARFAKLEYKTNTHRKTCSVDHFDKTVNWTLHDVTPMEIDSIVNELYGVPMNELSK
jgi:hypothetical protein